MHVSIDLILYANSLFITLKPVVFYANEYLHTIFKQFDI